jgi:hypothetical protein
MVKHWTQVMSHGVALRATAGRVAQVAVVSLMAALVACGGGGGADAGSGDPPTGGQPSADYFPLASGDRWTYREAGTVATVRVVGTRVAQGVNAIVVRVDDATGSSEGLYNKTAGGVFLLPSDGADAVERALASIPVLKLPVVAGSSDVALDQTFQGYADFDGDGRADTLALRVVTSVIGFETLTTPVATLTNVAHARVVLTATFTFAGNGRPVQTITTSDDWYAPDIGPVRNVTTTTGNGSSGSESNAVAYRVGNRRSESTPPTVASTTPADASVTRGTSVNVRFSEAMDRLAGGGYGFTLTGPDGQAVAGSVFWDDDVNFRFQPTAPLGTGQYSASLAQVAEDWAGNTLDATRTWRFSIDVTGPQVASSSPMQGAVEVPLSNAITLTFNEDLDPATVDASTFTLVDLRASSFLSASVSLSGRTVTVTPTAPLQRAGRYRVNVNTTLLDPLGNQAPGYSLDFAADPGRFSAPAQLPGVGSQVRAVGVADLNGDGRNDVVVVGDGQTAETGILRLRVLYRLADGTLAAPVTVDSGLSCAPDSMVVGDLEGDASTDIVVASGCGLAVVRQGSGGTLTPQLLDNNPSTVLALVRQAADGRLGILSQGVVANTLRLEFWRQTAPGVFALSAGFPQAMNNTIAAAVADFNGDGRFDIVLSGLLTSNNGNGLAVLYQQADGSFGGLRELPLTLAFPTKDVAAGDLNGDGRADIVFTTCCNSPTYIGTVIQRADGSFAAMSSVASYDMPQTVVVADVTGDGRLDVLVSHEGWGAVGLYTQAADGTLGAEQRFEGPYGCGSLNNIAVGDINADGLQDIVYCNTSLRQRPPPTTSASSVSGVRGLWRRSTAPSAGR